MGRVVVIGGGFSGLAVATLLADGPEPREPGSTAGNHVEVTVLEGGDHPGGRTRSDRADGRVLDHATAGWFDDEPALDQLILRAGLRPHLRTAGPDAHLRWLFREGRLLAAPQDVSGLLRTPLLSWRGRLRLLLEPLISRGPASAGEDGDESFADFVRRRLGAEAVDAVATPLAQGLYATAPEALSLRAAFPALANAERRYRSLLFAPKREGPHHPFQTLDGGAGMLPQALAAMLGDRVRCHAPAVALEQRRDGWWVHLQDGTLNADAVVLACPAPAQAQLVRGVDHDAAAALDSLQFAPVAVVIGVWPQGAFPTPPTGFGVSPTRGDQDGVLSVVHASTLFPGRPDELTLRFYLGGASRPEILDQDDAAIARAAISAAERYYGRATAPPLVTHVIRQPRWMPVYAPGHLARIRAVRGARSRHPGLYFAGDHMDGVGLKGCARASVGVAERVSQFLAARV